MSPYKEKHEHRGGNALWRCKHLLSVALFICIGAMIVLQFSFQRDVGKETAVKGLREKVTSKSKKVYVALPDLIGSAAKLEPEIEQTGKEHPDGETVAPLSLAATGAMATAQRFEWYRTVYQHLEPRPFDGQGAARINETLCGGAPSFDTYFSMRRGRSANCEDQWIYRLFRSQLQALGSRGHYVELGAFDGITEANTRFFDSCLGWTGLLIEGNPVKYERLRKNRPFAHRMNFAPSCNAEGAPNKTVQFHPVLYLNGGVEGFAKTYLNRTSIAVPCGPLTPVLSDVLGGRVHFFSLDVEGSEATVLRNIDFASVKIDVIMVESWNDNCPKEPAECETRAQTREIMKSAGYRLYKRAIFKSDLFVHPNSVFQLSWNPDDYPRRRRC